VDPSSPEIALGAVVVLLGALVLETRVLPGTWVPGYHDVGLPLGASLPPIPERPKGSGDTDSVAWSVVGGRVRFAGRARERRVPAGLHGTVRFRDTPQGQQMRVSWSPPWAFAIAAGWACVVALERGDTFMVPLLAALGGVVGWLYWSQARRVAIELRMAFSRRSTRCDAPDRG